MLVSNDGPLKRLKHHKLAYLDCSLHLSDSRAGKTSRFDGANMLAASSIHHGAVLVRDDAQGGYRVDYSHQPDPDYPERFSPLAWPAVDIRAGAVIQAVNGGEAFSEGFKRLGCGKVIGTRTWGGEIWLSLDNWLVDHGIVSAAEFGVYGPEGKWLIEGNGVDPDIVVDNLSHPTFLGEDAQLKAAVDDLEEQIRLQPVTVPPPPSCPIKTATR